MVGSNEQSQHHKSSVPNTPKRKISRQEEQQKSNGGEVMDRSITTNGDLKTPKKISTSNNNNELIKNSNSTNVQKEKHKDTSTQDNKQQIQQIIGKDQQQHVKDEQSGEQAQINQITNQILDNDILNNVSTNL